VAGYEVRYSMMPITAETWYGATPISLAMSPGPAGLVEAVTVDGLTAGTTYYFAVKAFDDSARFAELSNIADAMTLYPQLAWYKQDAFWGSYADYRERSLTVEYMMRNKGNAMAFDATVVASFGIPSTCYPVTPMPVVVGDIPPDEGRAVVISYHVPAEAFSFVATTYAGCSDQNGDEHWFPKPLQQTGELAGSD
jgi:hypothetical protein